jgi:hypothetical protein
MSNCDAFEGYIVIHPPETPPRIDITYQKNLNYFKESSAVDYVITPKLVNTDESLRSVDSRK